MVLIMGASPALGSSRRSPSEGQHGEDYNFESLPLKIARLLFLWPSGFSQVRREPYQQNRLQVKSQELDSTQLRASASHRETVQMFKRSRSLETPQSRDLVLDSSWHCHKVHLGPEA